MPIDRDGLLAKTFAHFLVDNIEELYRLRDEALRKGIREREDDAEWQVLYKTGKEWFKLLAPVASGFVQALREEADLSSRQGRQREAP